MRLGPAATFAYRPRPSASCCAALVEARGAARPRRAARQSRRRRARARPELHAEAVDAFLRANGIDAGRSIVIGFHGQTVLHAPDARLTVQIGDGAALAGAPASRGLRLPRRRRRGRRAGRAAGAGLSPRAGAPGCRSGRSRSSISAASPTSPGSARDGDADRLRHRARQRADRRLVRAHAAPRCDADGALAAAGSVDDGCARATLLAHPFFGAAAAEIARPQRFLAGAGARPFAGGRRGDAHRLHRRRRRAGARAFPGAAATVDRRAAAAAQSTLMAMIARAAGAPLRRRGAGLDGDVDRGAGVGLSRGALGSRAAAHLPGTTGAPQPMTGGIYLGAR